MTKEPLYRLRGVVRRFGGTAALEVPELELERGKIHFLVGLEGFEGRRARTLSGGEGKRLAMARALAVRPEAILLDEPMANVDVSNGRIIEGLLGELSGRWGITVVATAHDVDQAYRLGARVVALHGGRLVDAPPDNVYSGEIVVRDGTKLVRVAEGLEVYVLTDLTGAVHIAIDARTVVLSREPVDSSARNQFSGRVVSARLCGDHVRVVVDMGVAISAWISPESLRDLRLHPGDHAAVSFKAASVRVFGSSANS